MAPGHRPVSRYQAPLYWLGQFMKSGKPPSLGCDDIGGPAGCIGGSTASPDCTCTYTHWAHAFRSATEGPHVRVFYLFQLLCVTCHQKLDGLATKQEVGSFGHKPPNCPAADQPGPRLSAPTPHPVCRISISARLRSFRSNPGTLLFSPTDTRNPQVLELDVFCLSLAVVFAPAFVYNWGTMLTCFKKLL